MINQETYFYCERCQGERLYHSVTKKVFDAAHMLDSTDSFDGVTKYLAVSQLRIVELYRVPAAALEAFSARMCAVPEFTQ